ncbi:hypothetical protein SAMN04244553_3596 [Nocardia amikacinitolerans]|uniref:Scaffolding protein n=1 Tax=Nocardia amikacinitolerans TaxID=756689 RepID=A0A285LGN7_9NOCA|nr:hypothetical protein [Nocardia amikacinitolerans]SNY84105.1 hypothetical protein SAMN04244553_3596 [Nocardia amikacinitolerans]
MSDETTNPQPTDVQPTDSTPAEPTTASDTDAAPKPAETVEFWKNKARDWESRSKANADKARQFDELQEQAKTELERAQDEAKRLAAQADSFRNRAVVGEAKSLASDFANPTVAVTLLGDLSGYVDDQGDIDSARLKSDLDDLLQREPYLARVQAPTGMRPNPAQGQSGNPSLTPSQRASESERQGDWKTAGAVKADQLLKLRPTQ